MRHRLITCNGRLQENLRIPKLEVLGLDGGLGFAVLLVVIQESKMITSQLLGVDLKWWRADSWGTARSVYLARGLRNCEGHSSKNPSRLLRLTFGGFRYAPLRQGPQELPGWILVEVCPCIGSLFNWILHRALLGGSRT